MLQPAMLEKSELLALVPLFSGLSVAELLLFAEHSSWQKLSKGQVVFSEGEQAQGIHVVLNGLLKIYHINALGRERVLHLIRPGNICGEAAVFQGGTYPAHAAVLEASTLVYVPKDFLLQEIVKNGDLALRMLAALSLRLRMFTRKLEAHGQTDAVPRLAGYLWHRLRLRSDFITKNFIFLDSKEISQGQELKLNLEVSREVLANILGLARETLSRAFSRLQQLGIIQVQGREITIIRLDELQNMANMTN